MTAPEDHMTHFVPIHHLRYRVPTRDHCMRSNTRFNTRAITAQMRGSLVSHPYVLSSTLDPSPLAPTFIPTETSAPIEIP
jgi:hypothetical protein